MDIIYRSRSTSIFPESCSECPFLRRPTQRDRCGFYSRDFEEPQGGKPDWCLLLEIEVNEGL